VREGRNRDNCAGGEQSLLRGHGSRHNRGHGDAVGIRPRLQRHLIRDLLPGDADANQYADPDADQYADADADPGEPNADEHADADRSRADADPDEHADPHCGSADADPDEYADAHRGSADADADEYTDAHRGSADADADQHADPTGTPGQVGIIATGPSLPAVVANALRSRRQPASGRPIVTPTSREHSDAGTG
jgi:hypothetical protein